MVRLKTRYILFEVLYPSDPQRTKQVGDEPFSLSTSILQRHHRVSSSQISAKTIVQEIRRSLQINFGDYGLGKAGSLLQVKYFSNRTSTGIIRCHREDIDLVLMALCLISNIGEVDSIILNAVKVSGTIKKIEQYAIRRSGGLLSAIQRDDREAFHDLGINEEKRDE